MDPVTAAGAATTVFSLFGYCIQGFILLTDAQNMGKWGERVGLLSNGVIHSSLHRFDDAIIRTLGYLKSLFEDTGKISDKYKFRLVEEQPDGKQGVNLAAITSGNSMLDSPGMKEFKKLVREIKNWVDYLWDILSQRENLKMMQAMDSMLTQIIALSDKVSGLQALEKALVNNLGSTQTEPILASAAHLRMTVLNDPEMNRDTIVSSRESAAVTPPYSIEELSMDEITEFVRMDNYPNVGMAKYHGESVFVEYAVYTNLDVWRFDEVLVRRAKNVAKFLNAEKHSAFRLLRCKGIAVQNKGLTAWRTKGGKGTIAFVHSIPDPFHSYPVSLPRLLETGGTSPPSVTTRLSIALRLLQGVKYTHTTGLLHRNIRSENIVFFVNQGAALRTGDCSVIPKPTLVGFAFARLDEVLLSIGPAPSYPPTDIYQHPFYIGEGYSRYAPYMDVYSLGTVLVELAEWKPLSDLVSTVIDVWKNPVVGNAEDVRGFLVDAASSGHGLQLQFRMGDVFARIVQLCLSANSDRQIPYGPTSSDEDKRSEVERALELLGKAVNELEKCWI